MGWSHRRANMVLDKEQTITGIKHFNTGRAVFQGNSSGQTTLNAASVAGAGVLTLPADHTGTLVAQSKVQTLTFKTINGDNNTLSNLDHGSEVDNPSSGVHGVSGSVVGTSDSQTLTNKIIAAGSNTITGLLHGTQVDNPTTAHGTTGSVVGTSDSQTLTNKTLSSNTTFSVAPTINDGIKFTFNPNGTTSGLNVGEHTAEPSAPVQGDIFYDGTAHQFKGRDNSGWLNLGGSTPLTTKGDLMVYTTTTTRLAVGTDGYVLEADSSAAAGVAWKDPTGSFPYWNGTPTSNGVATFGGGQAIDTSSSLTFSSSTLSVTNKVTCKYLEATGNGGKVHCAAQGSGSTPDSPALGDIYYDTDDYKLKVYSGASPSWVDLH